MQLTEQEIEKEIKEVNYVHHKENVSVCFIQLNNGFIVSGFSGVLDTSKFDEKLGEKYAYEDAFSKLWQILGYHKQVSA